MLFNKNNINNLHIVYLFEKITLYFKKNCPFIKLICIHHKNNLINPVGPTQEIQYHNILDIRSYSFLVLYIHIKRNAAISLS